MLLVVAEWCVPIVHIALLLFCLYEVIKYKRQVISNTQTKRLWRPVVVRSPIIIYQVISGDYSTFFFSLCNRSRKCSKQILHNGRCDSKREFHPYWKETRKVKNAECRHLNEKIDTLTNGLNVLQEQYSSSMSFK